MDNNYPLTKVNDNEYIEGYWFSNDKYNDIYPKPLATCNKVDQIFIEKFKKIMEKIKNKKIKGEYNGYFGYSHCRICSKKNGAMEYLLYVGNIKYRFPEGLLHYYIDHNVQPSTEFCEVIIQYSI